MQPTTNAAAANVAALKVPPHSIEAEQSVLGGLMLDNDVWDNVIEVLVDTDFYRYEHQVIFRSMQQLAHQNRPFDVVTLSESLKDLKELDNIGGEIYLFELSNNTPSVANIKAYAEIVRERSVTRQLIKVAQQIADSGYHPDGLTSNELLDLAEQRVFAIAEQNARKGGPIQIKELLTSALERIDELFHSDNPITGVPTGFTDLDNMTSGFQKSDLIIIAGRPSMGKTVLGVNIAENVAIATQKPVLIFSLEMPGSAIAMRMMSSLGSIEQHRLRTGRLNDDDWPRIGSAVNMLSAAPIFVDDTAGLTPAEVRSRARRLVREHGELGLIVIDYLQLMRVPGLSDNRVGEISEISRSLKALAKELEVPVVALSQLNRSLEQRADKRPVMSDLRESGAIEQDADVIAFIYRDEVYNPDSRDKGIAEIIISKQRNGPIGKVKMTFMGKYTRFSSFADMQTISYGKPE